VTNALAGQAIQSVIRKEKDQWCVRSPNNPDWSGGCFPSKGEAEDRLRAVEYFKHNKAAANIVLAYRVARRFEVKGALDLIPDFEEARAELKAGNVAKMVEFAKKAFDTLFPGGQPLPWFHGLSTVKRNQLKTLYRELQVFQQNAPSAETHPELLRGALVMVSGWPKALRTVEVASQAEEAGFQHGPFQVITMPGLTKLQVNSALEALDSASAKLRASFPKVLYGNVYLSNTLKKNVAAWYVSTEDKFYLNVAAKKRFDDVYTIIHELGHRHDTKFLSKEGRKKIWELSTRKVYEKLTFDAKLREQVADEAVTLAKAKAQGKPLTAPSPELVAWLKSPDGPNNPRELTTKFLNLQITEKELHSEMNGTKDAVVTTDKVLHGPLAVTPYGAKSPTENYAEAFAHYALGMAMPQEFVEVLADEK